MERVQHNTATGSPPAVSSSGGAGYFTKGDPNTSTSPTRVTVDWLNGIQEELINVISSAGLTPDINDNTQLEAAILQLADDARTPAEILTELLTVDGSGSGLDADLFDGLDSTQFLRSDAADVITASSLTIDPGGTTTAVFELGSTGGSSTPSIDFHSGASSTDYDARIVASGGNGSNDGGTLDISAANIDLNGNVTFTGATTLSGAPTIDLEAATKKYVDDTASAGGVQATTTLKGILEIATTTETQTKTDSTRAVVPSGLASITYDAWVAYDQVLDVITASYNVSSVVDNGIGKFTIYFDTDLSTANYAIFGTASMSTSDAQNRVVSPIDSAMAAGYLTVEVWSGSGNLLNETRVTVGVIE